VNSKIDRIKAGFNVSYDSNTFQGIKNNLIMQTKAGQQGDAVAKKETQIVSKLNFQPNNYLTQAGKLES